MVNNRIAYFDFLRGIAIIAVVSIHSFSSYNVKMNVDTQLDYNYLLRHIAQPAVSVFLAISGFFLANKNVSAVSAYLTFIKIHCSRVYLPMLIWSLPLFILTIKDKGLHMFDIGNFLFGGFSVYYFVILIIQFYLLLPVLQKVANNISGLIVSLLISLLSTLLIEYAFFVKGLSLPLLLYAGPFPYHLVFFVIGLYVGKHSLSNKFWKWYLGFAIIFLVGSYWESYLIAQMTGKIPSTGIRLMGLFYNILIIIFALSLKDVFKPSYFYYKLCKIGYYSFGIYLIHMYVNSFFIHKLALNWLLEIPIIIVISILIIAMGRLAFPVLSKKFLGF